MDQWLLVSGDFTPLGGMDRANHALAAGLARRGRTVELLTHRAWPDLAALGVRATIVGRPFGSHLLGGPLLYRAAARAGDRPGRRVVVNGGNAPARDVTWIHYLHAAYEPHADGVRARLQHAATRTRHLAHEREAVRTARFVVCNSRRTAADVAAAHGVPPSRVRVVYYGTDPATFSRVDEEQRRQARLALGWGADRRVALFVGALGDRRKGFDTLFDAWRQLSGVPSWDVDLAVVGAGSELGAWRARAERESLASVRFLGFRPDVERVMAAADVIVHPARYEAYGLGVHEGLCRGLAAVVSSSAGVAEQFSDDLRPLLLEDPNSASELAGRLRRWRDADAGFALAVQPLSARLRARTWDVMAGEFIEAVRS